jgi:Sigma-70 region 2
MTEAKNAPRREAVCSAPRGAPAFFYRRVRERADATDLAQEVYLRMLRVKDISAIRDSEAYPYSVASNLAKEHFGSDRRRGISVDVEDPTIQEQLADHFCPIGTTPAGTLDRERRGQLVPTFVPNPPSPTVAHCDSRSAVACCKLWIGNDR